MEFERLYGFDPTEFAIVRWFYRAGRGGAVKLILAFALCALASADTLFRIQAGGSSSTDSQGNAWQSDALYVIGGTPYSVPTPLSVPYRSMRSVAPGVKMEYTFPLPPGSYTVTLKFLEPRASQSFGLRTFDVSLNGVTRLLDFDLFAIAGALTPKDITFPVDVADKGIVLDIIARVGNGVISAIQIDGPPAPATPVYLTGPEAAKPVLCPAALAFYVALDTTPVHLWWCSKGSSPVWTRTLNDVLPVVTPVGQATIPCAIPDGTGMGKDPKGNTVPLFQWSVDTPATMARICYSYPKLTVMPVAWNGTWEAQCHLPGMAEGQCAVQ